MDIIAIGGAAVLIFMVVLTFISTGKEQSAEDFQNMGRSAGWFQLAGTYTAALLSAIGMVGLPGQSYSKGYLVGILAWGSAFATIFIALFYGPRIRKFKTDTFGGFFHERYNSDKLKVFIAVVVLVGTFASLLSQLIGSGVILEQVFRIPYNITVIIAIFLIVLMSVIGGNRSVTFANTLMFAVMAIGLGLVFGPSVIKAVGVENIRELVKTNPEYFSFNGSENIPTGTLLGTMFLWFFGTIGNPVNTTRPLIAKNNRELARGLTVAYVVTTVLIWSMHSAASSIKAIHPNLEQEVIPWAAVNLVPKAVGLVSALGLVSACISTAQTQILVIAQSLAIDIYGNIKESSSKETIMKATKVAIVLVGLVSIPLVLGRPGYIVVFGNFSASLFAATFFAGLTFGLLFDWSTKEGVLASVIVGFALDLLLHVYPIFLGESFGYTGYLPYSIHPAVWSTVASVIAMLIVSKYTKTDEVASEYFEQTMAIVEDKEDECSDKVMYGWAIGLIVAGIIALIALTVISKALY